MKDFKTFLRRPKLHQSKIRLTSYSGDKIPYILNAEYKDTNVKLHFLTAENNVIPTLGEKALNRLGLIKRVFTLAEDDAEPKEETHDSTRGSLWHQNHEIKRDKLSTKTSVEEYKEV